MREEDLKQITATMVEARKANQDLGVILSLALAQAARELGDVEELVCGRPGSWEADIIRKMARAGYQLRVEYEPYTDRLAPLFVAMGQAKADGGDLLSLAMGHAVDQLGGLDQFAGGSDWYWDLTNLGRQYSHHWDDGLDNI